MEKELKLVADFDSDMIVDFFGRLNRQGPGSDSTTTMVLNLVGQLPHGAKIADIGCGSGGQTLSLAAGTGGSITAIDIPEQYNHREAARQFAQRQLEEIDYYRQYKKNYGYVFYIGIKNK